MRDFETINDSVRNKTPYNSIMKKIDIIIDKLPEDYRKNYNYFNNGWNDLAAKMYYGDPQYSGMYFDIMVIPLFYNYFDLKNNPIDHFASYWRYIDINGSLVNRFYVWINYPYDESNIFREIILIHEFGHLLKCLNLVNQIVDEMDDVKLVFLLNSLNNKRYLHDNYFYQCCDKIYPKFKQYNQLVYEKELIEKTLEWFKKDSDQFFNRTELHLKKRENR